jgi:serine-type D-Ala-D-Ala carboxypeptidase/endopeptidase
VELTKLIFGARTGWLLSVALAVALSSRELASLEPPTIHAQPTAETRLVNMDSVVNQAAGDFMANACHVGLSIVAVKGTETRFYNYGSASRDAHELPDADSIYEIGSVTKTFTGALAAKAILEHRMELDADFRKYLPEDYPNLAWNGHPITLRDLATHRSGLLRDLPDAADLFAHPDYERLPEQLIARDSPYDHARYLRELHSVKLQSEPGTNEAYSNLGIKVIAFGLEKVYRVSFETLMEQEILGPLGMRSTGVVLDAAERGRLLKGYSRGGNVMPYHLRNAGAAYGLYSTTRDMAKYVRWQLDEADPVIRLAHELLRGNSENGQALIWNVSSQRGSRLLWHGGGTFGMTSQVVLYPDDKDGYVLLANDTCEGSESALKDIATKAHGELVSDRFGVGTSTTTILHSPANAP